MLQRRITYLGLPSHYYTIRPPPCKLSLRKKRNAVQFITQIAFWNSLVPQLGWKLTYPTSRTSLSLKGLLDSLLTEIVCIKPPTVTSVFFQQDHIWTWYKELAEKLVVNLWASRLPCLHRKEPHLLDPSCFCAVVVNF